MLRARSKTGRRSNVRLGAGKVRHLEVRTYCLKHQVVRGLNQVAKIATQTNEAYVCTKYFDRRRLQALLSLFKVCFAWLMLNLRVRGISWRRKCCPTFPANPPQESRRFQIENNKPATGNKKPANVRKPNKYRREAHKGCARKHVKCIAPQHIVWGSVQLVSTSLALRPSSIDASLVLSVNRHSFGSCLCRPHLPLNYDSSNTCSSAADIGTVCDDRQVLRQCCLLMEF